MIKALGWSFYLLLKFGFARFFFERVDHGRNRGDQHGGGLDGGPSHVNFSS